MKKIAIFTSARSDFGLLRRVIELCSYVFDVDLLIAGSHSSAYQETVTEIREHMRHLVVKQVPLAFTLDDLTPGAQCRAIAQMQLNLSGHLAEHRYDLFVILGDRWELFGATVPAFLFSIPIAHIHGGEVTEGAIDDSVRHAHTKLASLHFAANRTYAGNLSAMGEEDWRITVSGGCGTDAIHQVAIASKEEIAAQYGINLEDAIILVTCHPSTREFNVPVERQISSVLEALEQFSSHTIIFTAPGLEAGSELMIERIKQFVAAGTPGQRIYVASFGSKNYLAVLKHARVMVGNSSSGLLEAASFGVPCVNVGRRQSGRMASDSVLNADYACGDIAAQLNQALSEAFRQFSKHSGNPYDPHGDGRNADRIVYALQSALETLPTERLLTKKLDFQVHAEHWDQLLKGYK